MQRATPPSKLSRDNILYLRYDGQLSWSLHVPEQQNLDTATTSEEALRVEDDLEPREDSLEMTHSASGLLPVSSVTPPSQVQDSTGVSTIADKENSFQAYPIEASNDSAGGKIIGHYSSHYFFFHVVKV